MTQKFFCNKRLITIKHPEFICHECTTRGQSGYADMDQCNKHNLVPVEPIGRNSFKITKEGNDGKAD